MPEPGSLTGNLAKAVDRVVEADQAVRQRAADAAAQAAPQGPQDAPGRPETPPGPYSSAPPTGGRP